MSATSPTRRRSWRSATQWSTQHQTDHVNLLFNNAGIGGGGSVITDPREVWERTFNVCWGGVYLGVRTFLPLVIASDEGHIVNTSSVNGFWASIGPDRPHTAYSAAKFAVKGFSEALITDLRVNAPHVKVSVVMPGHIGTSIVENSMRHGARELDMETAEMVQLMSDMFRDQAPMTPPRRVPRSSTASARAAGGSWSATMPASSTSRCVPTPRSPTSR